MQATTTRTEPRPFEEMLIASTLESAQGQESLMEQIHRLNQERTLLQTRLARHPWSDREAAARIRAIATELEVCWTRVRRERATQRVQLEASLGIDPAAREASEHRRLQGSQEHAPQQTRRRQRVPPPCAS